MGEMHKKVKCLIKSICSDFWVESSQEYINSLSKSDMNSVIVAKNNPSKTSGMFSLSHLSRTCVTFSF